MTDSMRLPAVDEGHIRTGRPGVIGIAAVFSGGTPDLAAVRARVVERWSELPRVNWTLRPPPRRPGIRTGASLSSHRWTAAPFDTRYPSTGPSTSSGGASGCTQEAPQDVEFHNT
jgi:hypothetical protein